ncbi:assimilatory nitrite reductase (NAD(P)H) large subunit precursor [Motilibacter rhizosphaerae]|uniref:assimilatory sulfite reductase (ferredoxin) n=1 Tax=Motilibacter rhizosphaerae TaxID=598652 RepID=A0A4Q7NW07_9ACTN|nr:nitrite reductase large subunit NirB [Motilibacter rhizosphaerae]RZS91344.1 assimilatory nitrite reductase (NAD(P)H) large subunit precursor [Motilibacter rhizosphaerae]
MTHPRQLVVVGNGMVGQRFVESLRARDTAGEWKVTVLCEEPRPAYDRVGLSAWFSGSSEEELSLVPLGFYDDEPLLDLRLGETATAVDREGRTVTTSRGEVLPYDALVLATGSYAFVPPIEGKDLPGTFVYRTIEDLERIKAHAAGRRVGAVVGGGLLGLEAANALLGLGLETHVVEFAPRLMAVQIDEGGGTMLRRKVESLGISVHTSTATKALHAGEDGAVARMEFADGGDIEAEVVIFAAGVRARDELGRSSGLPVGQRGGIVVDASCRTEDPAVYAIGECACIEGAVYGLVAPGYTMAEIVAENLTGGSASFPGADLSTKLKLLGVDVASFGDAHGATADALEVVYADPVAGVYKKLVLTDDAQTLLGGVLVGDASAYPVLRGSVGRALPGSPEALLVGTGGGEIAGPSGDMQVCSCANVTADEIACAIHEGAEDVPALKACTRAGTGCGSCVPLLKKMLATAGVQQSRGLCEHFADLSRADLFDIVRVKRISTFSQLIAEHGTGRGCDICKPVVASILASLGNGHILKGEQAALQDTNDKFLANMQKDGTYSVVPRIPGGEITPEKLIVIGQVAQEFGLYTKITGGQRIDLFGARVEQLPLIWRKLVDAGFESGHAYGKALRTVKSCVGSTWCRYGVQDSVGLAVDLELRYRGLRAPHKIKAGVSGCARECAEARGKDVGVIATEKGWNLYVAGNGGFTPRHADLLAQDLSTEELVRTIDRFLMYYVRTADRLQRTAAWVESLEGGLDHLRAVVVEDSLGICAELDAAMEAHVAGYSDEWRDAIEDPETLKRFRSFVNAPDAPDSDVVFVTERDQHRPATAEERATLVAGARIPLRSEV